jgi:hypothetical protein
MPWRVVVAVAALTLLSTACGSDSGSSNGAGDRPSTDARLEIVSPAPSSVTGPNTLLKFNLIGATVLPPEQTTGPLKGDEGHIHVRLDGTLITMVYGLEQPLNNLSAGPHTVQAEFVAVDHQPFANPPVAAVVWQVKT